MAKGTADEVGEGKTVPSAAKAVPALVTTYGLKPVPFAGEARTLRG
jgi:hypothetical protein